MANWSLVTDLNERDQCCVVIDDRRCEQRAAWRIAGDAWDDYTYTCSDHVELATTPGHVVVPVACTCPMPAIGEMNPACVVHGVAIMAAPTGVERYDYTDGIIVYAGSRTAADSLHARMVVSRARQHIPSG